MTVADLRRDLSPVQAQALTIYGEARGESVRGLVAVLNVIANRIRDGRWGTTANDICFASWQFSCYNATDANAAPLLTIGEAWRAGRTPEQEDIVLATCLWLAAQTHQDVTGDATHYCRAGLARMPAWTQPPAVRTCQIGAHLFFRDVL